MRFLWLFNSHMFTLVSRMQHIVNYVHCLVTINRVDNPPWLAVSCILLLSEYTSIRLPLRLFKTHLIDPAFKPSKTSLLCRQNLRNLVTFTTIYWRTRFRKNSLLRVYFVAMATRFSTPRLVKFWFFWYFLF